MNVAEHEKLIIEQVAVVNAILDKNSKLYKTYISPIENNRIDVQSELSATRAILDDYNIQRLEKLEADYTEAIIQVEISCGLKESDELFDKEHEKLSTMRQNAKLELTDFEYYTSKCCEHEERNSFFSKCGLVESLIWDMQLDKLLTRYNLNKNFNQDEHIDFLAQLTTYLQTNYEIDGVEVVRFIFSMKKDCTIAYDKNENIWHLLLGNDIVFSNENLQDVFEYRNIVG